MDPAFESPNPLFASSPCAEDGKMVVVLHLRVFSGKITRILGNQTMNTAAVYRKILTPDTHRMVIDIPEEFRGRSVEIIVLPVMENHESEQTPHLAKDTIPIFTKTQIEEWAKAPEIQALSGALKNDH
jgi:hypothetical protein